MRFLGVIFFCLSVVASPVSAQEGDGAPGGIEIVVPEVLRNVEFLDNFITRIQESFADIMERAQAPFVAIGFLLMVAALVNNLYAASSFNQVLANLAKAFVLAGFIGAIPWLIPTIDKAGRDLGSVISGSDEGLFRPALQLHAIARVMTGALGPEVPGSSPIKLQDFPGAENVMENLYNLRLLGKSGEADAAEAEIAKLTNNYLMLLANINKEEEKAEAEGEVGGDFPLGYGGASVMYMPPSEYDIRRQNLRRNLAKSIREVEVSYVINGEEVTGSIAKAGLTDKNRGFLERNTGETVQKVLIWLGGALIFLLSGIFVLIGIAVNLFLEMQRFVMMVLLGMVLPLAFSGMMGKIYGQNGTRILMQFLMYASWPIAWAFVVLGTDALMDASMFTALASLYSDADARAMSDLILDGNVNGAGAYAASIGGVWMRGFTPFLSMAFLVVLLSLWMIVAPKMAVSVLGVMFAEAGELRAAQSQASQIGMGALKGVVGGAGAAVGVASAVGARILGGRPGNDGGSGGGSGSGGKGAPWVPKPPTQRGTGGGSGGGSGSSGKGTPWVPKPPTQRGTGGGSGGGSGSGGGLAKAGSKMAISSAKSAMFSAFR